ncbi:hypothetical protein AC579_477 [Pseudocercospora musae]|uniref:Uncharacterized protein n=1 Tax=Pseudocercospora musae TaxID=113226 RepID=A0A139IN72_9PEZI|nr:hypothetical protein AC579_477 [Pseudocercospora musae]
MPPTLSRRAEEIIRRELRAQGFANANPNNRATQQWQADHNASSILPSIVRRISSGQRLVSWRIQYHDSSASPAATPTYQCAQPAGAPTHQYPADSDLDISSASTNNQSITIRIRVGPNVAHIPGDRRDLARLHRWEIMSSGELERSSESVRGIVRRAQAILNDRERVPPEVIRALAEGLQLSRINWFLRSASESP